MSFGKERYTPLPPNKTNNIKLGFELSTFNLYLPGKKFGKLFKTFHCGKTIKPKSSKRDLTVEIEDEEYTVSLIHVCIRLRRVGEGGGVKYWRVS